MNLFLGVLLLTVVGLANAGPPSGNGHGHGHGNGPPRHASGYFIEPNADAAQANEGKNTGLLVGTLDDGMIEERAAPCSTANDCGPKEGCVEHDLNPATSSICVRCHYSDQDYAKCVFGCAIKWHGQIATIGKKAKNAGFNKCCSGFNNGCLACFNTEYVKKRSNQ